MRLNIAKLAKTNKLTTKEVADKVINEIKILDIEKYEISFEGVELVSLNFLNPFISYLNDVIDEETTVKILDNTQLQLDLIIEAYKNCRANRGKNNEEL